MHVCDTLVLCRYTEAARRLAEARLVPKDLHEDLKKHMISKRVNIIRRLDNLNVREEKIRDIFRAVHNGELSFA